MSLATPRSRVDDSNGGTARLPAFLITIDTEGDNLWVRPPQITTRNAAFLPRFQQLCERFGQKPTWLTNWEMVQCPVFREFGADVLRRGTGEIGMHLHAWNQPPLAPLTADDYARATYLIEYPEPLMRDKIRCITGALEDAFGTRVLSHRAGRWAMDERYARLLVEAGYRVDCSVTPHVSWAGHPGGTRGGSDYRDYPAEPYFVDLNDLRRPGAGELLEVPMTIIPNRPSAGLRAAIGALRRVPLGRKIADRVCPEVLWLRPNGRNRRDLLRVLDVAEQQRRPCVEFMLHSSEFMPGGSPIFADPRSIDRLYDDLTALFAAAAGRFVGMTLAEYYEQRAPRPAPAAA